MRFAARSFVSPRDLAAAVDVSESSLKRWADDGRIEVRRTAGGHRRIAIGEAIRFVRERGLVLVDPARLGLPDLGPQAPRIRPLASDDLGALFEAHRGRDAAQALLRAFLGGMSVAELCDGPVRGALEGIGRRYERHADGIAIEHGAVDACLQGLGAIRGLLSPRPGGSLAVGGAVEGDPYILPSLTVAMVVEEEGGRAINVGPNAPTRALAALVAEKRPSLVWRSASVAPDRAVRCGEIDWLADLVRDARSIVAVGGRGFRLDRSLPTGVQRFDSLQQLTGFLRAAWGAPASRGT